MPNLTQEELNSSHVEHMEITISKSNTKEIRNKQFAKILKQLIEEKGIAQYELADIVHITPASVNAYLKLKSMPSIEVLESMADYFGVTTDYMLGRDDSRKSEQMKMQEEILKLKRQLSEKEEKSRENEIVTKGKMLIIQINESGEMEVLRAK